MLAAFGFQKGLSQLQEMSPPLCKALCWGSEKDKGSGHTVLGLKELASQGDNTAHT